MRSDRQTGTRASGAYMLGVPEAGRTDRVPNTNRIAQHGMGGVRSIAEARPTAGAARVEAFVASICKAVGKQPIALLINN